MTTAPRTKRCAACNRFRRFVATLSFLWFRCERCRRHCCETCRDSFVWPYCSRACSDAELVELVELVPSRNDGDEVEADP